MNQKLSVNGEPIRPSTEGMLAVELFLNENYRFRRNVLNGKLEFATIKAENLLSDFRPLTTEALNSIVLRAKRLEISESNPKSDIMEYIHSEEVPVFNPIEEFLNGLGHLQRKTHRTHHQSVRR